MQIRKFEKKDLPQVLELCREVRNYHIEILNGYFAPQDDRFEQMGYLESLTDDKTIALVAEENDTILGYLLAELKLSPHLLAPKVAHICNIGVKKELQKTGLGKKLMDAFYEICRQNDIDEIRLSVYNKNISACRFYEKYGFEPLDQRMRLTLKK
jgi:ribosomal-protein-alanine N-acetyltransferase